MIKKSVMMLICLTSLMVYGTDEPTMVMRQQSADDQSWQAVDEPQTRGIMSSNGFYSQVISPSDLTCYPYTITKPGHYIVTRDFKHIITVERNSFPLIQVLASDVTIDFQGFMLYQDSTQLYDIENFLQSNLIDIGSPIQAVHNVTIKNGTLSSPAGYGIHVWGGCQTIRLENLTILKPLIAAVGLYNVTDTVISGCTFEYAGYYQALNDLYDTFGQTYIGVYEVYKEPNMGATAIMAAVCDDLTIQDCKISNNGIISVDYNTYGLYAYGGNNVKVINSQICNNNSGRITFPLRFRYSNGIELENNLLSSNHGGGIQVVTFQTCSSVNMHDNKLIYNHASTRAYEAEVDIFTTITSSDMVPAYEFSHLTQTWSDEPVALVNTALAYQDYKEALATIKAAYEDLSYLDANNGALVDAWNQLMNSWHAVDYALEYYTWLSRAYAIRVVNSSYMRFENNQIMNTFTSSNSAFGIMLDGSRDIYLAGNEVVGTQAFVSSGSPTQSGDVQTALLAMFGDLLDVDDDLNEGETISLIGRAVGIEIRNATSSVSIDNMLLKNTTSQYVFAAGLFFNRSIKSRICNSWLEMNVGADFGYGVVDRFVDPTDVVSHCTFYANGYETDKNRNWGMQWSSTGKFSSKHVFPGDLDLANNVGPYENLEILFDGVTEPNLDFEMPEVDIAGDYITEPI